MIFTASQRDMRKRPVICAARKRMLLRNVCCHTFTLRSRIHAQQIVRCSAGYLFLVARAVDLGITPVSSCPGLRVCFLLTVSS